MNLDCLIDFANEATADIAKYKIPVVLNADNILADGHAVETLNWQSISYGEAELDSVPDDKRGIYAFAICRLSAVLPPHSYILYIGIAGRNSDRTLRDRYKDYLNQRKVIKRVRIARMIGTWHQVLRFFFAPVDEDVSSDDLQRLEIQMNTAFMPPFSEGDLEAKTKLKRRAFLG